MNIYHIYTVILLIMSLIGAGTSFSFASSPLADCCPVFLGCISAWNNRFFEVTLSRFVDTFWELLCFLTSNFFNCCFLSSFSFDSSYFHIHLQAWDYADCLAIHLLPLLLLCFAGTIQYSSWLWWRRATDCASAGSTFSFLNNFLATRSTSTISCMFFRHFLFSDIDSYLKILFLCTRIVSICFV